jgi:hypothetical protein
MCFNPGPERRVPSPNRYIAYAKFCFCKNNKRIIIKGGREVKGGKGLMAKVWSMSSGTCTCKVRADSV